MTMPAKARDLGFVILCCVISVFYISCSEKINRSLPAQKEQPTPKVVSFSGYQWLVTHATQPAAPGPNFWSGQNVWVDREGKLHLRLTKDPVTGLWNCASLHTEIELGPGVYEFFVEGALDKFDRNIVLGLFAYSGTDTHDEIDIEFSRWGKEYGANLQYSVWPKAGIKASKWTSAAEITLEGTYTTHRIIRSSSFVKFRGLHGFRTDNRYSFYEANCRRKKIISTEPMPFYLNLWLFNGKAPSDDKEVEVIIHKFSFTPEK